MKQTSVHLMIAAALVGIGFAAHATTGVAIDDTNKILTITVDEGESKTLAEVAPNVYNKMGSGQTYQAYRLDKYGKGELKMTTWLGNYWGCPHVFEGTMVCATSSGIGANSRYWPTYVHSGATLIVNPVHYTDNRYNYIEGSGATGRYGALECAVTGSSYIRTVFPKNIFLTADATWAIQTRGYNQSVYESSITISGRTLTLTGLGGTDEQRCIFSGATIVPGNSNAKIIIGDLMRLRLRQGVNLGAAGTFELTGSGALEILGSDTQAGTTDNSGWKIIADSTKGFGGTFNAFSSFTRTGNAWNGPMELRRNTHFKMNSDYYHATATKKYGLLTVNGKITGVGGIYSHGYDDPNKIGYLMLGNAANDFAGGVAMTNVTLGLCSATALPATGKAQFSDASLMIMEPAATEPILVAFPELDFTVSSGKTSVLGSMLDTEATGAQVYGTTVKLTKGGEGTLDCQAAVAADEINLDGGVVRLPNAATRLAGARRAKAGLNAGYKYLNLSDSPFTAAGYRDIYPYLCITNYVALSPEVFYQAADWYPAGNNAWGEHNYQYFYVWDGYLWNNTTEVKTWKVVDTCNTIQRLTIGSAENAYTMESDRVSPWTDGVSDAYAPSIYTVTLQPGANRFIVRGYGRYDYKNFQHGNVRIKGLTNWTDAHGLMYTENLDSVDMNDYHAFIDSGDGTFFTRTAEIAVTPVSVVRGNGGTLDLQDGTMTATAVEGKPVVTGGTLNVTGSWTLTAAQLKSSVRMSGVAFGSDVELNVAAAELEQLKLGSRGYVIAENFTGTVPRVSASLAAARWKLLLENGTLRFTNPQGLTVIVR